MPQKAMKPRVTHGKKKRRIGKIMTGHTAQVAQVVFIGTSRRWNRPEHTLYIQFILYTYIYIIQYKYTCKSCDRKKKQCKRRANTYVAVTFVSIVTEGMYLLLSATMTHWNSRYCRDFFHLFFFSFFYFFFLCIFILLKYLLFKNKKWNLKKIRCFRFVHV